MLLLTSDTLLAAVRLAPDRQELPAATDYSYACVPVANEVLHPSQVDESLLVKQQRPLNLGYMTNRSCWTQIEIINEAKTPRLVYLEHAMSQEDVIRAFQAQGDGWKDIGRAGNLYPVESWPIHYRLPTFEVQLEPGLNRLRIYQVTRDITGIDWKIWEPKAFHRAVDWENLLFGGFFAICLALSLYNLVIFAVSGDKSYLYYFLYLSSYGWVQMFLTGFLKLLLPDMGTSLGTMGVLSICMSMIFVYLFVADMLEVRRFPKIWRRIYWFQACLPILNVPVILFLPFAIGAQNCLLQTGIGSITALAFGIISLRQRSPLAPLFMVAWGLLLIGTSIQTGTIAGFLDSNPFTRSANFIGATFEAILISYALAFKMRHERMAETKRRKHAFSQLEKMVYPHQLTQMKEGHQLEETMPLAMGQAFVICVDMVNSSRHNIGELKIFLRAFFDECGAIMNRGYGETGMQAYGFRIKEMGDGFLCSIGFPFATPEQVNSRELALDMAYDFIAKFEDVLRRIPLTGSSDPILSIGIAEGSIEGFFTLSGIRSYELFGRGIVLATRYEALRKIFAIPGHGHLICLRSTVYDALPPRYSQDFTRFNLEQPHHFIRDDEQVKHFYYQRISHAAQKIKSA